MKLIKPAFKILDLMSYEEPINEYKNPIELIEYAGRTCYKSEEKMTFDSAKKFIKNILANGHESVIEHSAMTVKFICDRGVSHELVRHRLCSFSQESTRYCNYKGGVTFVIPPWCDEIFETDNHFFINLSTLSKNQKLWINAMEIAEEHYKLLLNNDWTAQQARAVLPNSLKTEIVMTANLREWRHIFKLRCAKAAHPQMREIMIPLLNAMKLIIPVLFEDISY